MHIDILALFAADPWTGNEIEIIDKPTKIEFFTRPLTFRIPTQVAYYFLKPNGIRSQQIARDTCITTEAGRPHLAICCRAPGKTPNEIDEATRFCNQQIDQAITSIAAKLSSTLLVPIYRGQFFPTSDISLTFKMQWANPINISDESIKVKLSETTRRFRPVEPFSPQLNTISRLFPRTLQMDFNEEKFLLQWSILEVYPMLGTRRPGKIIDLLAERTGKKRQTIAEAIQPGAIYGDRHKLVHQGKFISGARLAFVEERMSAMVDQVVKHLLGEPYDGELERLCPG
jgi:hypothetical protein